MTASLAPQKGESAKQWLRLGSHEAALNQIDTALLRAAKTGSSPPSSRMVFGALSDASIACAEVIDAYAERPIPLNVRTGLARVHCVITDLAASLQIYAAVSVRDP